MINACLRSVIALSCAAFSMHGLLWSAEPAKGASPAAYAPREPAADAPTLSPLIAAPHPGEPLWFALRLPVEAEGAPIGKAIGLGDLEITLTLPSGGERRCAPPDAQALERQKTHRGSLRATTFLRVDRDGVTLNHHEQMGDAFEYLSSRLRWGDTRLGADDLELEGAYQLRVRVGAQAVQAQVSRRGSTAQRFDHAQLRATATAAVARLLPDAALPFPATLVWADDLGRNQVQGAGKRSVGIDVEGPRWATDRYVVTFDLAGAPQSVVKHQIGGCLATGSPIATPSGPIAVESLAPGAEVYALDERGRACITRVRWVAAVGVRATVVLDDDLRLSREHPVAVPGGWCAAGALNIGDAVLGQDGRPRRLRSVAESAEIPCWDISVDAPHCFVAAGIVVHNKDRTWVAAYDDGWRRLWPKPEQRTVVWSGPNHR